MSRLRVRFIISHVLPVLIIVPLFGLVLLYILETQVLLDNANNELVAQAELIAEVANTQPGVWQDPQVAQEYVQVIGRRVQVQVLIMNSTGILLATSDPEYTAYLGQVLDFPEKEMVLTSKQPVPVTGVDTTGVAVPAMGADDEVVGLVQVTNDLSSAATRIFRLRQVIFAVLGGELLLGAVIGLLLALNLERPLKRVTKAIYGIGEGETAPIPAEGPTEIKQLAEAFNILVNRLHLLEETRRRLLANLVHELGRPLGALRSAVHSLRHGGDEDSRFREELLAGMEAELDRMAPMLDDLSRLHEQVLGSISLNREETVLTTWLMTTLTPWRESAQRQGLRWQMGLPDTLPPVMIDQNRLGQALGNLLSNAIKYTRPGGTISVAAGQQEEEIWIRVSDTGPGIPQADHDRIFEPFYRGDQDSRFPQGLGLGLTIARDMVQAHGGRITLVSSSGKGSHFTIYLPL